MMNMRVLPPELSVDSEKVEATAGDFAGEPIPVGSESLADLLYAKHLLAMPMHNQSLTLCALKKRNLFVEFRSGRDVLRPGSLDVMNDVRRQEDARRLRGPVDGRCGAGAESFDAKQARLRIDQAVEAKSYVVRRLTGGRPFLVPVCSLEDGAGGPARCHETAGLYGLAKKEKAVAQRDVSAIPAARLILDHLPALHCENLAAEFPPIPLARVPSDEKNSHAPTLTSRWLTDCRSPAAARDPTTHHSSGAAVRLKPAAGRCSGVLGSSLQRCESMLLAKERQITGRTTPASEARVRDGPIPSARIPI